MKLFYLKWTFVIALLAVTTSCSTISRPPNFDEYVNYAFIVDGRNLDLHLPSGSNRSAYVREVVNTTEENKETIFLESFGYDLYQSRTAWYNLTNVSLGLTKKFCCSHEQISSNFYPGKALEYCINGNLWLNYEEYQPDGDYLVMFANPFGSKYGLFYTLRIDSVVSQKKNFIQQRVSMFRKSINNLSFSDQVSKKCPI